MEYYCTLFDRNYLARGLALYESLAATHSTYFLTVLCLDQFVFDALSAQALTNVELLPLERLERHDPHLAATRPTRTAAEYCFTCKSILMRYVFERHPNATRITYLDSDLYFFNSPTPLNAEINDSSVALTPHRFPPHLQGRYQYGRFNAGWISVGSGREGGDFLAWWRQSCIDWCKTVVDNGRYADQGYLDQVPQLFPNAHIVGQSGANVAPWNISKHQLSVFQDKVLTDNVPLIFYHFHGLRRIYWRIYDTGLSAYGASLTSAARNLLYRPYLYALTRSLNAIENYRSSSAAAREYITFDGAPYKSGIASTFLALYNLARSKTGMVLP